MTFGSGNINLKAFLRYWQDPPDPDRSVSEYRALARNYDSTAHRIRGIRRDAIASLGLQSSETVLEVACGTGECLPVLADLVGPKGRVVGVEHSLEMAAIARQRIDQQFPQRSNIDLVVSAMETLSMTHRFDAVLMTFTHDVLQSEMAVERLIAHCRSGTRIAVAGLCFLPWPWGAPVNLYNAVRARRYMTTFRGLREPWAPLVPSCPDLTVEARYLVGSCYRARGTVSNVTF